MRYPRLGALPAVVGALLVGSSTAATAAGPATAAPAVIRPAPSPPATTQPATAPVPAPDTTVGRQVGWLVDASRRLPVPETELRAHLTEPSLTALGGVAGINALLRTAAGDTGLRLAAYRAQFRREDGYAFGTLHGAGRTWHLVAIAVADGRLGRLAITPVPTSWAELDGRLGRLAPRATLLAAEVTGAGRCRPVHTVGAATARPIGSVFKLYVLGALGEAVRRGSASWDEPFAVRDEWKVSRTEPVGALAAGTRLPLRTYAEYMIYYSDNSATDHLMHRLGRSAVEAQQVRFGTRRPDANTPMLTTREVLQLKTIDYPRYADAYAGLPTDAHRRAFLREVLPGLPPPAGSWPEPRHIDSIEWFASANDLCRIMTGLQRQSRVPGQRDIGRVLSLEGTTSVGLDLARWPVGRFKGGSEPGVLARNYLARTATGRTFAVAVLLSDPARSINDSARTAELLALVNGGFGLLDRS